MKTLPLIKLTETNDWPCNGCQIYGADLRHKELSDIEDELQDELKSYANVGYNSFLFNRSLATIFISRIEVKTMQDVFNTDMYGLLTD